MVASDRSGIRQNSPAKETTKKEFGRIPLRGFTLAGLDQKFHQADAEIRGETVHEAFFLTYQLVEACRVQLLTLSSAKTDSDYTVVPEQIVEETYQIVQDKYTGEDFGKMEWEAAKRKMESNQGSTYQQ